MDIIKGKGNIDIEVKDAAQFLKDLRAGKTPDEAALNVGKPLAKLMRNPEIIEKLERLKDYYFAKAEDRKALVIAKMTDVLLNGDDRDATAAAKVIVSDPELGFGNQGTTVNVTISDDLKTLDPGDPWSEEK